MVSIQHQKKTMGVATYKRDQNDNTISTKIRTDERVQNVLKEEDGKPSIARTLFKALDPQGRLIGTDGFSRPDATSFKDFYKSDSTNTPSVNRLYLSEEEGSYVGINHAFVENYCSYYSRESDDGDGTKYNVFSCQSNADTNRSYVIHDCAYGGNLGNPGGQTQLLRIRIIQLLNEYYGDWKWVGDPTAKIKVVSQVIATVD